MARRVAVCVGIGLAFAAAAAAQSPETGPPPFEERQSACLRAIHASPGAAPFEKAAAAVMLETGLLEANQTLAAMEPENVNLVQCMAALRLLMAFPPEDERLYPETRAKLEELTGGYLRENEPFLVRTEAGYPIPESHGITGPSALWLWSEYAAGRVPGWKPADPGGPDRWRGSIRELIREWAFTGFRDRGSPHYVHILAALMNLRDFAPDGDMRQLVAAGADLAAADMALESLGGHWGGARRGGVEPGGEGAAELTQYILFGAGGIPDPPDASASALIACHTGYRPPEVLAQIARQREARGIYETKHLYRTEDGRPGGDLPLGRKYAYVTPEFVLGSLQLRRGAVPWHTRPWDLLIRGGGGRLFSFAGNQLFSGGEPPLRDSHYSWNATVFQHKSVLYCQFLRSGKTFASADGGPPARIPRHELLPTRMWVPAGLENLVQRGGWWFAAKGGVYLAFRPLEGGGYWWRAAEGGGAGPANILTFQELGAGFVLEAELARNAESFEAFQASVIESPFLVEDDSVTMISRAGDVIRFPRGGGLPRVNGRELNPWRDPQYGLFSSPYVKSEYGSGRFIAEWPPYFLRLDFNPPGAPLREAGENPSGNARP